MNNLRQRVALILTTLSLGLGLQAQTYHAVGVMPQTEDVSGSTSNTPTLKTRPQVQSLLIGRGDTLQINVYNEPDLAQSSLVDDAGNVPLVMGGTVHLSGLSLEQAGVAISDALRQAQIMKNAHVVVTITGFGTQAISVFGEIAHPGTVTVTTPRHILDVISLSGGFTPIADRIHVTVQHGSDPKNSEAVVLSNDPNVSLAGNNTTVNPGDTVIVPRAPVVYVIGNVQHPGAYVMQYDSQMTAMQAIAFAGGSLPDSKDGAVHLIRKVEGVTHEAKVPIKEIQKGKTDDIQLAGNDVLYVPFSFTKHWVMAGGSLITSGASTVVYAAH